MNPSGAFDFQPVGEDSYNLHLLDSIWAPQDMLNVSINPANKGNTIVVPISPRDDRNVAYIRPWNVFHHCLEKVFNVPGDLIDQRFINLCKRVMLGSS